MSSCRCGCDVEQCVNCSADIKGGLLSSNAALPSETVELINFVNGTSWAGACQKCGQQAADNAPFELSKLVKAKRKDAEPLLSCLPLTSIPSPLGWVYDTIGLVTAQTVSGTGMFSDVSSAFTDLFGAQSATYNNKLRAAENMCRASLRAQTFKQGGNAIVGVDVDYAEVGGQRAMLMVCMTGTAVKVRDMSIIGEEFSRNFAELERQSAILADLTDAARRFNVTVA